MPTGFGRKPENIRGQIFVAVLGGFGSARFVFDEPFAFGIGEAEQQLLTFFLEGVGDVFEEDETQADVLVFRGVHVPAHLVGGGPKLCFKVEGGAVGFRFGGFHFRHCARVAERAVVAKTGMFSASRRTRQAGRLCYENEDDDGEDLVAVKRRPEFFAASSSAG